MKVLEKVGLMQKVKLKSPRFQVIILKTKPVKNSFDGKILGRTLCEWVIFACNGQNVSVYDYDNKINPLEFVKDKINNDYEYTILLMSSTPLLEQRDISSIIEYSSIKKINLCKLPTGYVFYNNYLASGNTQVDSIYSANIDNFYLVENKKQFNYALNILQDRINSFHMENGVEILKPSSVYIEPEVDIDGGVVIYPNNSLKGTTQISRDVILKENNVIENSKIGENSCVSSSVIEDSIISSGVYISAFCEIKNSLIGKDTLIEKGVSISNYNIDVGSKIKANTILGENNNDSSSGVGKSG